MVVHTRSTVMTRRNRLLVALGVILALALLTAIHALTSRDDSDQGCHWNPVTAMQECRP